MFCLYRHATSTILVLANITCMNVRVSVTKMVSSRGEVSAPSSMYELSHCALCIPPLPRRPC